MEWDLSQYEISNDGNPTFMIGDPMKKVYMGNNKSLVNPASTNKIYPIVIFEINFFNYSLNGQRSYYEIQTICYILVPNKFTPPLMLKEHFSHSVNLSLFLLSPYVILVPKKKNYDDLLN